MTGHVCEVWAEQGRCPHTRPDLGERIENALDGIDGDRLKAAAGNFRAALENMRQPLMIPVLVASKS